jgi:hypothetical protein
MLITETSALAPLPPLLLLQPAAVAALPAAAAPQPAKALAVAARTKVNVAASQWLFGLRQTGPWLLLAHSSSQ